MGLNIENVCKSYNGKKVLDNISFNMDDPGVFGLLGTNGAGKTTTIRIILGILEKDSGNVSWDKKSVTRENVNFGYLPEERGIYPKAKVGEQLIYFAELKGLSKEQAKASLDKWSKRMKIEEYLDMPAEKLSKGNQQKAQFLTCVMHDPELMILDEPFSGMDPINTDIFKSVINELVSKGKYIIMSAHQMPTIEEFCHNIIILNKGRTVLKGNLKEIKDSYDIKKISIETSKNVDDVIKSFNLEVLKKEDNSYLVGIDNLSQSQEVLKAISAKGIQVNKFELVKPTLYDIFVEKVGEDKWESLKRY